MLVTLAWVFFRADTPTDALTILKKIFTDYSFNIEYLKDTVSFLSLSIAVVAYAVLALLLMLTLERLKYPSKPSVLDKLSSRSRSVLRFVLYAVMIWCIVGVWAMLQASNIGSSFIYFQF